MAQEKKKKVAAIQYDSGDQSPKLIAKGQGLMADRILEKAEEADIPLYEDPKLAEALNQLDIGEYIPEELYTAVAQVLIFVTDLDKLRDRYNL